MFTNEFFFSQTVTTIMDDGGELEDVVVIMDEDTIGIRQYNELGDYYDTIIMTPQMYLELIKSFSETEGLFKLTFDKDQ